MIKTRQRLAAIALALAVPLSNTAVVHAAPTAPEAHNAETAENISFPLSGMKGEENFAREIQELLDATENMPEELQSRPSNSPEVIEWLQDNDQLPTTAPRFAAFNCGVQVVTWIVSLGWPVARVRAVVKEFGGTVKFAKQVFEFLRHRTMPADISKDGVELLTHLVGVHEPISACF